MKTLLGYLTAFLAASIAHGQSIQISSDLTQPIKIPFIDITKERINAIYVSVDGTVHYDVDMPGLNTAWLAPWADSESRTYVINAVSESGFNWPIGVYYVESSTIVNTTGAVGTAVHHSYDLDLRHSVGGWIDAYAEDVSGFYGAPTFSINTSVFVTSRDPLGGAFGQPHFDAAIYILTHPVPEPASWIMMLGGLGLVGGAARYRRKQTVRFA